MQLVLSTEQLWLLIETGSGLTKCMLRTSDGDTQVHLIHGKQPREVQNWQEFHLIIFRTRVQKRSSKMLSR